MTNNAKPPYLPFRTFLHALDLLASSMPARVKREFFDSYSLALRGQVIGALQFFDLIDKNGEYVGDTLENLAIQKRVGARKTNLKPLLRTCYAEIMKLDLKRVTRAELEKAFADHGISGDTKKKAQAFFLKAAEFAGFELSRHVTHRRRGPSSKKKLDPSGENADARTNAVSALDSVDSIMSRTLRLKCGGSLTLIVKGNILDSDEDWKKVQAFLKLLRS